MLAISKSIINKNLITACQSFPLTSLYSTTPVTYRGRSVWKGPYIDAELLAPDGAEYDDWPIMSRASVIPMSMIGQNVLIHNGQDFDRVLINRDKVGYKFGEFAFTRTHTHKEKAKLSFGTPKKDKK